MGRPTLEDARVLLWLYELRQDPTFRLARKEFAASFHPLTIQQLLNLCPAGSDHEAYFWMVYSYWETAAWFVTAGALNEELFMQNSSELLLVWERSRSLVPQWRLAWNNPKTVKDIGEVACRAACYLNDGHPEAHATFVANTQASAYN